MMVSTQRLVIDHTWDGLPLARADQSIVTVALVPGDGDSHMVVTIDAPFYREPPPPVRGDDDRCYDGLWNFEVVELFIGPARGAGEGTTLPYLELEFGPHGHALGLSFGAYRQLTRLVSVPGQARVEADRWRAEARIPDGWLAPTPWDLNAYSIRGPQNDRRYAAAFPPSHAATADFHHRGSWRQSPLSWGST